ncbi:unnamed protein product, partial [Rotaria sp. Silwood1]
VGPKTNHYQTQCFSTHLTKFAGGWIVIPKSLDWKYMKENAQFEQNKTIYATLITIDSLFIFIFIFAAMKDRKYVKKVTFS